MKFHIAVLVWLLLVGPSVQVWGGEPFPPGEWPRISQTALPWTRWWWHGSAVDKENLTRCLEAYQAAGLGGVEITCIYGVKGAEDRELPYLSHEWADALEHALQEAQRLGLGVDLPPGSGWRMGGPELPLEESNMELNFDSVELAAGATFHATFSEAPPAAVVATNENGDQEDLTKLLDSQGYIEWTAPQDQGNWSLLITGTRYLHEKVKRPAPGGAGLNINPFSERSVKSFLNWFASKLSGVSLNLIRCTFHDSFEYEGNWSHSFFDKFQENRGYDLRDHLHLLAGQGKTDEVARLKCDYRETMSDLVLDELVTPWIEWAHGLGQLARNQSHGSPANWLDLYGACDIPETESFGRLDDEDSNPLLQKYASSAAHVAGRELVSSETATWLDEHFTVSLEQVKERIDRQMLAGINHILYHGTAYSPAEAKWPGWVFYASTQLNPQNPVWRDFPALNQYVARCQSVLQSGEPANDVLIYWPIHDFWHNPRGLRYNLRVHNSQEWFVKQPFGAVVREFDRAGVSFDYISDAQILRCSAEGDRIKTSGADYTAVVVPPVKHMPIGTLEKLSELASAGANVFFVEAWPESYPGRRSPDKEVTFSTAVRAAELVAEKVDTAQQLIAESLIPYQPFYESTPIRFVKRKLPDGDIYFLKNLGEEDFDDWLPLAAEDNFATCMDPLTGKVGAASVNDEGKFRVQLAAGSTIFLRTHREQPEVPNWQYLEAQAPAVEVASVWEISFLEGGPELPLSYTIHELAAWTSTDSENSKRFAGTAAYSTTISSPPNGAGWYKLDLGEVHDSARVLVNDKHVCTLIAEPFEARIQLHSGNNDLRVEVTNVAANRIRDLDRRKIPWRIFHDINVVNINYRPFDAANWRVRPAGLVGPVTFQKLDAK